MAAFIFFFLGIPAILFEFMTLQDVTYVNNFTERLRKVSKYSNIQAVYVFFSMMYFVWIIIGLATSQWTMFAAILILALIPKRNVYVRWLDSFITLGLILFAIINRFYFHIDVFKWLIS